MSSDLENQRLSRREMISAAAAASLTTGGTSNISTGNSTNYNPEDDLPIELKIYPDQEIGGRNYRQHYSIAKEKIQNSFEDLYDRDKVDTEVYVSFGEPVEISEEEDLSQHLEEFEELASEPASHGNLLLSSQLYGDGFNPGEPHAVGKGQIGSGGSCTLSGEDSRYSIMESGRITNSSFYRHGDDMIEENRTPLRPYLEEKGDHGYLANPFIRLNTAIHELGHNHCLEHEDGEIYIEEEGENEILVGTPMVGGYMEDFIGGKNSAGKEMPENPRRDWWISFEFADTAVKKIEKRYKN